MKEDKEEGRIRKMRSLWTYTPSAAGPIQRLDRTRPKIHWRPPAQLQCAPRISNKPKEERKQDSREGGGIDDAAYLPEEQHAAADGEGGIARSAAATRQGVPDGGGSRRQEDPAGEREGREERPIARVLER